MVSDLEPGLQLPDTNSGNAPKLDFPKRNATMTTSTVMPDVAAQIAAQPAGFRLGVLCAEPVARQAYRELGEAAGFTVVEHDRPEQLWRALERQAGEAGRVDIP